MRKCNKYLRAWARITSLRTERTRSGCQRIIFESIYARNVPPRLMHTETSLSMRVTTRTQLFAAISESEKIKSEKDELFLHRSTEKDTI